MRILSDQFFDRIAMRSGGAPSWSRVNEMRKIRLLVYAMSCLTLVLGLFILLNLFHFRMYALAAIEAGFFVLCVGTLWDLWAHGHLQRASWLAACTTGGLMLAVFYAVQAQFSAAIWLLVAPMLAFFLLGRRWGLAFAGVYTALVITLIVTHYPVWPALQQNGGAAVTNILAASLCIFLVTHYYESTRGESFTIIERIANTDYLTGVANRRHFFERLQEVVAETRREPTSFALIILDIDFFKRINDEHGHAAGDKVLVELAHLLQAITRPYDVLGRLGGEEFGILLRGILDSDALTKAERLRLCVQEHAFQYESEAIPVTISVGLATFSATRTASLDEVYNCADMHLYQAKRSGRNRVAIGPSEPEPVRETTNA